MQTRDQTMTDHPSKTLQRAAIEIAVVAMAGWKRKYK
jgi:hypothetical protein